VGSGCWRDGRIQSCNAPPKPKGGGGNGAPGPRGCASMGLALDWPSAAYEDVMESMTDWAFSWPISVV